MENLELNELGDIKINNKLVLICFDKYPNLSQEVVNRYNEHPYLIKEIERLKSHIETVELVMQESIELIQTK